MNCNSIRAVVAATVFLLGPVAAWADVVLDWNVTMFATVSGQNPFSTARYAAITQLAVFEAVNAVTGEYEPYLGTVAAPVGASAEAAAAAAAHGVLTHYFPARVAALDAALANSLGPIPDGQGRADGIATGQAAAAAMIALRDNDGSAIPAFYAPISAEPGQWQPTPSCSPLGGGQLHWRNVTPFGVPSIAAFRLGPPPALETGGYSKDYTEVKAVGAADSQVRTPDRADVARFFAMFSPASWSNAAARQVAAAQGRSLSDNARAFALLNMALSDGSVAAFDAKYHYNFWRPETAIHAGDGDDNAKTEGDALFAPFIVAPCFPGYPSAHASVSYSAREVLERLYGPRGHDITFSNVNLPGVLLHYTEFKRIVEDVDDARVFGGIHFRFDQDAGASQGRSVGAYIYKHHLRPVHPD